MYILCDHALRGMENSMVGKHISHYEILEKLGEGGMGVVYKARDTKLERTVALKFLPPELTGDSDAKKRFIQEAKAASALQHNNVATIHEIDEIVMEDREQMFICMDYYTGEALNKKIRSGPVKIEEAIDIAIQIAQGLDKAHSKGIVHRDIKPGNIVLAEDGVVKIVDFGLAKLAGRSRITKDQSTLGTTAYMSPEQAEGKETDHRSDIWSSGIVLYEMLTGRLPFQGDYDQAVLYAIINEKPDPPTGVRTGIPMELENIVSKCLEKDVSLRYQHTDDLLADLRRLKRDTDRGIHTHVSETGPIISEILYSKKRPLRKRLLVGLVTVLGLASVILAILFLMPNNKTIDSLAILPFSYPSDQPEIRYLSESIPDRILFKLQKLPNLKRVIPFSSVLQYYREDVPDLLDAGRALGVKAVGIGRMSMINEHLDINIEIIDVKNNNLILKEPYTEKLANLTHIPITIAQDISTKLGHRLSGDEQIRLMSRESENSEAYQHYLIGRFHWNKRSPEGIRNAIEYFHRAITKDSAFALAHAGLADAYITLPQYSGAILDDVWDNAKSAAVKAMALAPDLSEARIAYGNILENEWKWEEARREIEIAIEMDPNNSYAHFSHAMLLAILGDLNGAIAEHKAALRLDPFSMVANRNLGWVYTALHQYGNATKQFQKTLAIAPDDANTYLFQAGINLMEEDVEKFIKNVHRYYQLLNLPNTDEIFIKSFPGEEVRRNLLPNYFSLIQSEIQKTNHPILNKPMSRSISYAIQGNVDSLFIMLHRSIDFRDYMLAVVLRHPIMDPYRSDPRFREVLKRVHLESYY